MNTTHRIQWKGVISGPFTREELDRLLACGEISLLHRIEAEDQWLSLGDFLKREAERQPAPILRPPPIPAPEPDMSDGGAPTFARSNRRGTTTPTDFPAALDNDFADDTDDATPPPPLPRATTASHPAAAAAAKPAPANANADATAPHNLVVAGYILCGACFVLPLIATLAAAALAYHFHALGIREHARSQAFFCGLFTLLGLIFWGFLKYFIY